MQVLPGQDSETLYIFKKSNSVCMNIIEIHEVLRNIRIHVGACRGYNSKKSGWEAGKTYVQRKENGLIKK